jgi:outer membrane protein
MSGCDQRLPLKRDLSDFPGTIIQGVQKANPMTSMFARVLLASAFVLPLPVLSQTSNTAALPAAPSAAAAPASAPAPTGAAGTKVGTIDIQDAIVATNEGQRDFEALNKKFEPKRTELKGLNDELENLRKQLNTQGDKMNDEARATLVKQIEQKQKALTRSSEDAQNDYQSQQGEIAQRILQKMAPLLVKYAGDNGYGVIIDTSNRWPNGQVIWAGAAVDITRVIVEAYNVQSGVPAPVRPAAAATRPAGTGTPAPATKPATTPATKPPDTQPK